VGAWGHFPMENDEALAWVNVVVEKPMVRAISKAIRSYLDARRPTAIKKMEAEAAISLLIFFTTQSDKQYCGIDLREQARQDGLWKLADRALERLSNDEKWLRDWNEAEKKKAIWSQMRAKLVQDEHTRAADPR